MRLGFICGLSAFALVACGGGQDPAAPSESATAAREQAQALPAQDSAQLTIPVYRFANTAKDAFFFTANEEEKEAVLRDRPDLRYEGIAFRAYAVPTWSDPQRALAWRFANLNNGGYLYTTSQAEVDLIRQSRPDLRYEGPAFAVAPAERAGRPIYRLAHLRNGTYHYTASLPEARAAEATASWRFEGVIFNEPAGTGWLRAQGAPSSTPGPAYWLAGDDDTASGMPDYPANAYGCTAAVGGGNYIYEACNGSGTVSLMVRERQSARLLGLMSRAFADSVESVGFDAPSNSVLVLHSRTDFRPTIFGGENRLDVYEGKLAPLGSLDQLRSVRLPQRERQSAQAVATCDEGFAYVVSAGRNFLEWLAPQAGYLYRIDLSTGNIVWERPLHTSPSGLHCNPATGHVMLVQGQQSSGFGHVPTPAPQPELLHALVAFRPDGSVAASWNGERVRDVSMDRLSGRFFAGTRGKLLSFSPDLVLRSQIELPVDRITSNDFQPAYHDGAVWAVVDQADGVIARFAIDAGGGLRRDGQIVRQGAYQVSSVQ